MRRESRRGNSEKTAGRLWKGEHLGATKIVILAGGMGTRLREETEYKPKPMVEIGGRPILWHIMKLYAHHGFNQFVICLGYKGDVIRDYFLSYETRNRDFTVRLGSREIEIHGKNHTEDGWRVTLADTGEKTLTGGRIKRIARYVEGERFMATYGDGVADLDIKRLLAFHQQQGRLATVTAVRPSSRYGELAISHGRASGFREKPQVHEGWINGGFFVFEPAVFDLIEEEQESIEEGLLVRLVERGELAVYQHEGFWQCMDTYREMELLNALWASDRAPWRFDCNRKPNTNGREGL
jgi:glucose-1-phosphate cytidylyltransferase